MGAVADSFGFPQPLTKITVVQRCVNHLNCGILYTVYRLSGFPICNPCCSDQTGHTIPYWEAPPGLPFPVIGKPSGSWAISAENSITAYQASYMQQSIQQKPHSIITPVSQTQGQFKIGDIVEVIDYNQSQKWNGVQLEVTGFSVHTVFGKILSSNAPAPMGGDAGFSPKNLKLATLGMENNVFKYSVDATRKLKLKASDLRLTIIESKFSELVGGSTLVKFKLENGTTSDWVEKSELDKIVTEIS